MAHSIFLHPQVLCSGWHRSPTMLLQIFVILHAPISHSLYTTMHHNFQTIDASSCWRLVPLVPRSSFKSSFCGGYRARGDPRTLLIRGAGAALRHARHKRDRRGLWIGALSSRSEPNIAAVALATKNARVL